MMVLSFGMGVWTSSEKAVTEPTFFGLFLLDIQAPCTHRKAVNQYVMYIGGVPVLAVFDSVITTSAVNLLGS